MLLLSCEAAEVEAEREAAEAEAGQHVRVEALALGGHEVPWHGGCCVREPVIARANAIGLDFEAEP